MSNLVAFNSVLERAMRVEEHRVSYDETLRIQVPTQVIIFAKSHIDLLEEQLSKLQAENRRLRIESKTVSGEELNRRVTEPRESSFGIA